MEDVYMCIAKSLGCGLHRLLNLTRHLVLPSFVLLALLFGGGAQAADTQKPTAPTSLRVPEPSDTGLTLHWISSTDNVGVTEYHIERCVGGGCTIWVEIATTAVNSFVDNGLTPSTTYRYRVRAGDAAGNLSKYSNIIGVKTADFDPPTTPSGLTATANSVIKITLTWVAATDNAQVTGYSVERCGGVGCNDFAQIATTGGAALSYGNTGLTPITTYRYRISAIDAAGNASDYSTIVSTTTLADATKPTVPSGLVAVAISSGQIDLNWTASTDAVGVTGYRIERCTGESCTKYTEISTTTATTYSDASLAAATTYRYRVRAGDASGNLSNYSTVVNATTPLSSDTEAPTVPNGVIATATSPGRIGLSWIASTDNTGVTGYRIRRCQGTACTDYSLITVALTPGYIDAGLASSTSYSYRVSAIDGAGNSSAYSSAVSATTLSNSGSITFTYSYDGLGRITKAAGSDGSVIEYQYDANGNLLTINRQ